MIGVVVPAHNEEGYIGDCVQSLLAACKHPSLDGEDVSILVVLDSCTDRTGALARALGVETIALSARNVGLARQMGAAQLVSQGARWLSFTDADSLVAADWLARQLALGADAVCGTVAVADWSTYGEHMKEHFHATYSDVDGHAHIHGANIGISTPAYLKAGGFLPLDTGEDVALVKALQDSGAVIAWSAAPRVLTSVRSNYRAPGGFGATLERIERLGLYAKAAAPIPV